MYFLLHLLDLTYSNPVMIGFGFEIYLLIICFKLRLPLDSVKLREDVEHFALSKK